MECKKSKFRTAKDADFQIEQLRRRKGKRFVPMEKYHCKECDTWHITSNTSKSVDPLTRTLELKIEEYKKQLGEFSRAIKKRDQTILLLQEKIEQMKKDHGG